MLHGIGNRRGVGQRKKEGLRETRWTKSKRSLFFEILIQSNQLHSFVLSAIPRIPIQYQYQVSINNNNVSVSFVWHHSRWWTKGKEQALYPAPFYGVSVLPKVPRFCKFLISKSITAISKLHIYAEGHPGPIEEPHWFSSSPMPNMSTEEKQALVSKFYCHNNQTNIFKSASTSWSTCGINMHLAGRGLSRCTQCAGSASCHKGIGELISKSIIWCLFKEGATATVRNWRSRRFTEPLP